jgi:hypothetical protein
MLLAAVTIEFPPFYSLPIPQFMSGIPSRPPEIARPKSNLTNDNQAEENANQQV